MRCGVDVGPATQPSLALGPRISFMPWANRVFGIFKPAGTDVGTQSSLAACCSRTERHVRPRRVPMSQLVGCWDQYGAAIAGLVVAGRWLSITPSRPHLSSLLCPWSWHGRQNTKESWHQRVRASFPGTGARSWLRSLSWKWQPGSRHSSPAPRVHFALGVQN